MKNGLQLDYAVYTLDNRLLLSAGTRLTPEVMETLICTETQKTHQDLSFLEYGTVYKDLVRLIRKPPYRSIFNAQRRTIALSLIQRIRFILPVLESLDYFKQYDYYTYRHTLIVFALSTVMAQDLLQNSKDWITEAMAGHMHDFGKICVPLQVLKKSTILTRTERYVLEHHTLAGFVLLGYLLQDPASFAARIAMEHHERRDGSGYPAGISLEDKMVEIIAACDIYDALLSVRPYRSVSYDNRTALEEITEMANKGKLSWDVVQALVSYNRKDKPRLEECRVSLEKRGAPPARNLYGMITEEETIPPQNR